MRRGLICLLLLVVASLATGAISAAQPKPEFNLGFKLLADQIPNVVGSPIEAEHYGPNGDSLQQTTTGLMVWRKADNWTAFTDGTSTWINGPEEVQSRPNGERFPWESETKVGDPTAAPSPSRAASPVATLPSVAPMSLLASLDHLGPDGRSLHVASVAFSPDGRSLASAAYSPALEQDPSIKLWDTTTGRELRTFTGHKGWILGLSFSPEGRFLASSASDGAVMLWDVNGGELVRSMNWLDSTWADSVAFSPDGKLIAAGMSNGTIRLWDSSTGQISRTLGKGDWEWIFGVAFSPDGNSLAAGNWNGNVQLWDLTSNTQVKTFNHPWQVYKVAFSPDGHQLATASRLGTVKLWNVVSGSEEGTVTLDKKVNSVAFSPDGRLLAIGVAADPGANSVYLWDVAGMRQVAVFAGQKQWPEDVAFSPKGDLLASGGAGGDVRLWKLR